MQRDQPKTRPVYSKCPSAWRTNGLLRPRITLRAPLSDAPSSLTTRSPTGLLTVLAFAIRHSILSGSLFPAATATLNLAGGFCPPVIVLYDFAQDTDFAGGSKYSSDFAEVSCCHVTISRNVPHSETKPHTTALFQTLFALVLRVTQRWILMPDRLSPRTVTAIQSVQPPHWPTTLRASCNNNPLLRSTTTNTPRYLHPSRHGRRSLQQQRVSPSGDRTKRYASHSGPTRLHPGPVEDRDM